MMTAKQIADFIKLVADEAFEGRISVEENCHIIKELRGLATSLEMLDQVDRLLEYVPEGE